jgi:hypothetical protein
MRRRASSYRHDAMDGGLPMFAAGLRNALSRAGNLPPPNAKRPGSGEPGRFKFTVT